MTTTILNNIVKDKHIYLQKRKEDQPLDTFIHLLQPSERSFYDALNQKKCVFILECKKASPSKGVICEHFNPKEIAQTYQPYAAAISVLTDEKYFQGSYDFLTQVSQAVVQPVLCKDFIIDFYQIYLARHYGADAILLMLSTLNDEQYKALAQVAKNLNMGVLTEVSNEEELERAIHLDAPIIGINNRDLRDLSINLNKVQELTSRIAIPKGTIIISESGIYTHQQMKKIRPFAQGFLIGSALMSEKNLAQAIHKIIYGEHKICGLTRKEDAVSAYHAGAVYGGLIFAEHSPRFIPEKTAKEIIQAAPLNYVGVFVNSIIEDVALMAKNLNLFAVQLHGDEDESYVANLRKKLPKNCQIWRAYDATNPLPTIKNKHINRYILDNGKGGTGETFNWSVLNRNTEIPIMLAGGLNASNLQEALTLKVTGFDFNSGVEISPGIKDKTKINAIFNQLRNY